MTDDIQVVFRHNQIETTMTDTSALNARGASPTITELRVVPVAGQDSMLLNLSGAHGPQIGRAHV